MSDHAFTISEKLYEDKTEIAVESLKLALRDLKSAIVAGVQNVAHEGEFNHETGEYEGPVVDSRLIRLGKLVNEIVWFLEKENGF